MKYRRLSGDWDTWIQNICLALDLAIGHHLDDGDFQNPILRDVRTSSLQIKDAERIFKIKFHT
jgi:hypothetical protein